MTVFSRRGVLGALGGVAALPATQPARSKEAPVSSAADFDFLCHAWTVRHRKLKTWLAGADDWVEFEGTSTTRPILGGGGNVEDNLINAPGGAYRAAAVRSFDAKDKVWRIWWLDQRFPAEIGPPVVGQFEGDRGVFITDDTWQGIPIQMRFIWLKDDGPKERNHGPRWEQAFSKDGGTTWEVNWVMEFRRQA